VASFPFVEWSNHNEVEKQRKIQHKQPDRPNDFPRGGLKKTESVEYGAKIFPDKCTILF